MAISYPADQNIPNRGYSHRDTRRDFGPHLEILFPGKTYGILFKLHPIFIGCAKYLSNLIFDLLIELLNLLARCAFR